MNSKKQAAESKRKTARTKSLKDKIIKDKIIEDKIIEEQKQDRRMKDRKMPGVCLSLRDSLLHFSAPYFSVLSLLLLVLFCNCLTSIILIPIVRFFGIRWPLLSVGQKGFLIILPFNYFALMILTFNDLMSLTLIRGILQSVGLICLFDGFAFICSL